MVRLDELEADGLADVVVAPRDTLLRCWASSPRRACHRPLVVQFWGEAMVDAELKAEMARTAAKLGHALTIAVLPWARTRTGSRAEAARLAEQTARTLTALAQGYMANSAVFGRRDPAEYVESAASTLSA